MYIFFKNGAKTKRTKKKNKGQDDIKALGKIYNLLIIHHYKFYQGVGVL